MSFLESLVGNAAITGEGIINSKIAQQNAIDQDNNRSANALSNQKSLAQFNQELEIARTNTLKELAAKTGQSINEGADKAYRGRIAGIINSANGSSMSEEDARAIAENPAALKAYGVDARTRSQEYDDKIRAAESLGALPEAKELRGQQDVEYNRDRLASRDKKDDANTEIQNRRLDQQLQFQKEDAAIRNRLAGAAEARANRADSRASAQMDKAELQSTRQSLTSVLTDIGKQQDRIEGLMATAMDPEQQAVYRKQLAKLDASRDVARGRLNELAGVDMTAANESKPTDDGVRYDAQGVAYVRGPDGKPVRRDAQSSVATGSTPAPKAKADDAAAPTSPSKPQPQTPTSTLDKMLAKNLDALRTMAQQVAQAEAQLAAVAKSGDAKSTVSYAKNLQALREQMRASAAEHFGNGAQAAIAQVSKSQ